MRSGLPGPKTPKSSAMKTTTWHCSKKGRFRKRVVLANVPSFRLSFRGNMRTYPRSGFNLMSFRGNIRTYLRSGFRSERTSAKIRRAPDTSNFLRHVMRAIWSVRPKCSHRCVSLKETPLKPVQSLKHTTKNSSEQTVMRTKWFKHIAI